MNTEALLQSLFGSAGCVRVLLLLHLIEESWAREIARFWDSPVYPVQKQLEKLRSGGVLKSRQAGRTRLYSFDMTSPLHRETRRLLNRALTHTGLEGTSLEPLGKLLQGRAGYSSYL